jgi:DNA polymerase-1
MRYITNTNAQSFTTAVLIKDAALRKPNLDQYVFTPLGLRDVDTDHMLSAGLKYDDPKKVKASTQKQWLADLLPDLDSLGITTLLVCDSNYFKTLTKERKAEPHYGYVVPCAVDGFEHFNVVLAPNYQSLFYSPENQSKLDLALDTLASHIKGKYQAIGTGIVHSAHYPTKLFDIENTLLKLHEYPQLTCDIETYALQFNEAGIGTIAFAWDQHNGTAFRVDFAKDDPNHEVRKLLRDFFDEYQGTLIFHNANFDMKVLVYVLYMSNMLDEHGKQNGIQKLTRRFHDTKLITYLATNSTTGNKLSLKDQAHAFAGNYAQSDINDISLIDEDVLLEYNLVDCLSTWYVFNKHFVNMIEDDQLDIYESLFKPSVKVILQMELTGMPLNLRTVAKTRQELEQEIQSCREFFDQSPIIEEYTYMLREQEQTKANAKLKKKVKPIEDFSHIQFNPNSAPQLQSLFYEYLNFPVVDTTDSRAPAVGAKTLKKLTNYTEDEHLKELITVLVRFFEADKILGTFVKAFEDNSIEKAGWHYLHGNFNLGGTVSGRLSSSGPNLQNIPSTRSSYAKPIKKCFEAPPGWLFMGADFASLEDRISALTTKDPNKLKVYTDGYDGHCLRAYGYFGDEMPNIDPNSVSSINSIEDKYPDLRQRSKTPTFALTYGGTYMTLMKNENMPEDEAKQIETNYHKLYEVSDQWVAEKIKKASQTGYVEVAFGLRVRTPIIAKCIMHEDTAPREALAEGRTAGNALGQSYGLLNNRAAVDLQERVFNSKYRYDILPVAHIHDAQYFLVRDNIDVIEYLNNNLVECMEWQNLPDIYHPDVGLGGQLSAFYPTWADEIKLPNYVSQEELKQAASA